MRRQKLQVSTLDIIFKAQQMAKADGVNDFKGTNNWCYKFMKRNGLSMRSTTSTGQHLPDDWEVKVESFLLFMKNNKADVELAHLGNMDEVPCSFDIPRNRTVDEVEKEDISVVTTGRERFICISKWN